MRYIPLFWKHLESMWLYNGCIFSTLEMKLRKRIMGFFNILNVKKFISNILENIWNQQKIKCKNMGNQLQAEKLQGSLLIISTSVISSYWSTNIFWIPEGHVWACLHRNYVQFLLFIIKYQLFLLDLLQLIQCLTIT